MPLELPDNFIDPPRGGTFSPAGPGFGPGGGFGGGILGGGGGGSLGYRPQFSPAAALMARRKQSALRGGFGKPGASATPLDNILHPQPSGHGLLESVGLGTQKDSGTPFDPNDPYGAFSGDTRNDFRGEQNRIFGDFGRSGAYGPEGSKAVMDSLMRAGTAQGLADEQGAVLNAGMEAGDDPALAAIMRLQARTGASNRMSDTLNNARTSQLLGQQDFGRQWANTWQQGEQGLVNNESVARLTPKPNNGWGQTLGGIAGGVAGSFLGPVGTAAGGALGRNLFGKASPTR